MIIGKGDIGTALKEARRPADESYIFFASGISNSKEDRESEYQREIKLLMEQDRYKHIVYFSSLAIFYAKTRYTKHKLGIEELIKKNFHHYTIIRLGNITWGNNPHTIINFLKNKIKNNELYSIKDEYRYLVWLEEFLHWIDLIPDWNCEMNITGQMLKVEEIVDMIKRQEL